MGKGVLKAVQNVNTILSEELKGISFEQRVIDQTMINLDGTPNKSKLGAMLFWAFHWHLQKQLLQSWEDHYIATLRVNATTLPVPMMNILNGGSHADNKIDIQEFMVMPFGASSFSEALRMGTEVFHHLKNVLKKNGMSTNVGDEGGFAPALGSNEEAIEVVLEAIKAAGYTPGKDIWIALDAASSEFL